VTQPSRIETIRQRLAATGLRAFAANDPANVAYLTGFEAVFDEEPASVALVTRESLTIYTDGRYVEAVEVASAGTPWDVQLVKEGLWEAVAAGASADDPDSRLGVESSVTVQAFRGLQKDLADRVESVDNWVEEARRVKDPGEIERISAAQQLTDAAFEHVLGVIGPGVTEVALALDIEVFLRLHGSEGVAFPPIVASGPASSRPHALATDRQVAAGDLVLLDFGAKIDGYCADMTRTVVVGSASDRQREIHDAVRAANEAGIAHVSAEHTGVEADAAARAVLAERGLVDAFTHGLGHGVGRDVHEMPSVSARGTERLRVGEVVTVEPGVYVPGFGGVRIEDLVVVEAVGCRVLTTSTKDLIEI
jgi:Xaa-Pro aminopeptidase